MPLEYSDNIPAMFGRVYTAPPPEIFFDMYENDASFDEAAKNLYDKEMEADYDTDLLDEFLTPGIEDFDDTAVEKAIYQIGIAQEQGRNPVDITITPYGSGLLQDEYDEVINMYPGIGAGVEWRTMDDHYHDAEEMLNDPRAGTAISNLIDVAVEKAEDEGAIDSLGDIFKAFGEQLGRAGQSAAEAHVASRTELDSDTGDLFLGPSVGPNPPWEVLEAVRNTADGIEKVFDEGAGESPSTGGQPADPVDRLIEFFEKMLVGEATNQDILRDVHRAFSATTDHDLFAEAMRKWINTGDWNDKVENAGAKPRDLFDELFSEFSQEPYDTFQWSGDPTARAQPTKTEVDVSEEEKKKSKRQNRMDVLKKEYEDRGTPISDEEAGVIVDAGEGEGEEGDREAIIKDLMEDGFSRKDAAEYADDKISRIAVEPSEMRERHTRALSKAFYETIYAQPWGGRAEFASILPSMLSETKTLFLLNAFTNSEKRLAHNTTPGLLVQEYGESPELGTVGAPSPVGDAYKAFLNKYLRNPSVYRTGSGLAKHVERINELLRKRIEEPGAWTDKKDIDDWLWIEPMFWGTSSEAQTNRYNLITMVAAQGQQGYMANIIKAGTSSAIEHYENMGYAGSEIFALMTSVFGRTGGRATSSDPSQAGGSLNVRPPTKRGGFVPGMADPFLGDMGGEEQALPPMSLSEEDRADILADVDMSVPPIDYSWDPANPGATLRGALMHNRMEYIGETFDEAKEYTDAFLENFPQQPTDFLTPTAFEASVGLSPASDDKVDIPLDEFPLVTQGISPTLKRQSTLSSDDIADILADFDMGVEMSIPPSRRMGPSQYPSEFVM